MHSYATSCVYARRVFVKTWNHLGIVLELVAVEAVVLLVMRRGADRLVAEDEHLEGSAIILHRGLHPDLRAGTGAWIEHEGSAPRPDHFYAVDVRKWFHLSNVRVRSTAAAIARIASGERW